MKRIFQGTLLPLIFCLIAIQVPAQGNPLSVFIQPYQKLPGCRCALGSATDLENTRMAHCEIASKRNEPGRTYTFLIFAAENKKEMIAVTETEECRVEDCSNHLTMYEVTDTGFVKSSFMLPEPEQDTWLKTGYFFDRVRLIPTHHLGSQYKIENDSTISIEFIELRKTGFESPGKPATFAEFSSIIAYHLREHRWIPELPKISMSPEIVWKKIEGHFTYIGNVIDPRGYTEVLGAPDDGAAIKAVLYANMNCCFDLPVNEKDEWVRVFSRNGSNGWVRLAKLEYTKVVK